MKIKPTKSSAPLKSIGYLILKHKNKISVILAIVTLSFGIIGFMKNSNGFWLSVISSIKLFGLDFPTNSEILNGYIFTAIFLVIITLTFTIVLIFIKDGLERFQRYITFRNDHIAVFGLGEASVSFLNSYSKEPRKERVVIIESDPNNKKLDEYRNLGYGVLVGDSFSENILQRLNFKKMKYALITMGSDGINIELAKRIIKKYKEEEIQTAIKLIVHILNPELDTLFVQNIEDVLPGKDKAIVNADSDPTETIGLIGRMKKKVCPKKLDNKEKENAGNEEKSKFKIDIKTFSFYNEAAEGLFEEHHIDGNSNKYILGGETYKSILIGNGELTKSVIYQMALLSHLPEENIHKVYIVDRYATNFLVEIKKRLHYSKVKFPKLKIKAIDIDKDSNDYFTNSIWDKKNLVNIIIAYDNQADNLNLAIELFNRTFRAKAIGEKCEIPKIIFAVYDQLLLSEIINKNKEAFEHFYTFGNSEKVLSYICLIEEEKDMLAQLIHSGYKGAYNPLILHKGITPKINIWQNAIRSLFCRTIEVDPILAKWYNTAEYVDRLSNISQAKHIDMKLKAMGFKRRSVFEKTKDSFTVSFVGSTPNLENELKSVGLFMRNMIDDNTNSSEDMPIEKPISYSLKRKTKKYLAKKDEQRFLIKKVLLSINRQLLTNKFKNDRILSRVIDDDYLKYYTEELNMCSDIRKGFKDELEKNINQLKDEFEKTKKTHKDIQKHQMDINDANDKSEKDCLKELKGKGVDDIKVAYFPKDFDTLFEKMIRIEHNRWIAYHYLNGWEYGKIHNKENKVHNCLIPLEEFKEDAMLKSVIYDMYSFLYLPNYLAEAGYEIVPIKDN